tara:strand:- start:864 stop:1037 length:174 start_codon:yes stop_codon:yes gene_type:complete
MRIGLIWGVDTWMTYPYLIGGDDFTAHPLVFARGIESQKTQNFYPWNGNWSHSHLGL